MVTKFGHVIMTSAEARGILKTHAGNEARIEELENAGRMLLETIASYQRITDGLTAALVSIPCMGDDECDLDHPTSLCPVHLAILRAQSVVMEHTPA